MYSSGDAAESMVRMSLEGMEFALKISGTGAKNIAVYLAVLAKSSKKMKGKTSLTSLLKSGKQLKVFSLKKEDLKKFIQEAKKYGILFHTIIDKKANDGLIDIIVRSEDAGKVNRIVERFKLNKIETAKIDKKEEKNINPPLAKTEKSHLSEPTLKKKSRQEKGTGDKKESVKEKINSIKKTQNLKTKSSSRRNKSKGKSKNIDRKR